MEFTFYKYQGTGNDFILVDNRSGFFPKEDTSLIAEICHRRFGVGGDGLILLENHPTADFKMIYFNSDGNESSMCGNGGRCITHFAHYLGLIESACVFEAIDGLHKATIKKDFVSLQMNDVTEIKSGDDFLFLDTGSPHHVSMVSNLDNYDVFTNGKDIRNRVYGEKGSNVNFVEQLGASLFAVRTYERGVEDETLSCGTGVTAVAIAMYESQKTNANKISLQTPGGNLQVQLNKTEQGYKDIFLEGPAIQIFKGLWK